MTRRVLIALAVGVAIAVATYTVSRGFGFTFLFLPLLFVWGWGGGRHDGDRWGDDGDGAWPDDLRASPDDADGWPGGDRHEGVSRGGGTSLPPGDDDGAPRLPPPAVPR